MAVDRARSAGDAGKEVDGKAVVGDELAAVLLADDDAVGSPVGLGVGSPLQPASAAASAAMQDIAAMDRLPMCIGTDLAESAAAVAAESGAADHSAVHPTDDVPQRKRTHLLVRKQLLR